MARARGNGGIIGPKASVSGAGAAGMWSLVEHEVNAVAGTWPVISTIDFNISPAVGGVTAWSITANGPLNLSTSGEWTITMVRAAAVNIKMWGGGGGPGGNYTQAFAPSNQIGPGGGGGFAGGAVTLANGSTYILRVGQGGSRANPGSQSGATYLKGGVNSNVWGSEGGGYTGIFLTSVTQGNAILMAGGGGGGSDTGFATAGGAGGGSTGETPSGGLQSGSGGTQSAGGAATAYNGGTAGSALTGGITGNGKAYGPGNLGGGGGGYYGGGGGNVGGGGGGSGFASGAVTGATLTTGSGGTPGNSGDAVRSGSGTGGTGSTAGTDGRIYISF